MRSYSAFARVYDAFMGDYDYEKVLDFLKAEVFSSGPQQLLELACGTGSLTEKLWAYGMVDALDLSEEMLIVARQKLGNNRRVRFLRADMKEIPGGRTYDVVLCLCDSLNYLRGEEELRACLSSVLAHLKPEGVFVFDMKPREFFEAIDGKTYVEEEGKTLLLWQNQKEGQKHHYLLTLFAEEEDGRYRREEEEHTQWIFEKDLVEEVCRQVGGELTWREDLNARKVGLIRRRKEYGG